MATLVQGKKIGEVFKWELNPAYNRHSASFKNDSGIAIDIDGCSYPVKIVASQFVPIVAGDEDACTGLINQQGKIVLPDNGVKQFCSALVRGPAIINRSQLPTVDVAGDELDVDELVTALLAVGIVAQAESPTQETQVT